MRLKNSGKFINTSKIVSKYERYVKRIFRKNNTQTGTTVPKEKKTLDV